jgi:hypothetical protein
MDLDREFVEDLILRYKWLGVSVRDELIKAQSWVDANPKRRKRNWERFVVNWMNRASQSQEARLLAQRIRQADPWAYKRAVGQ